MNFMTNYSLKNNLLIRFSGHFSRIFIPAVLAGFIFIAVSCEEAPSLTGSELLPGSDFVELKGSLLKVKSYTMYRDSIASSQPSRSFLGSFYDPYFGTTTCEFVSQLRLGSEWETGKFYIDSMKLFLSLLSVSGDTASSHYLRLSEIADVIYKDKTYYSSQNVAHTGYTVPDILLPTLRADTANSIFCYIDTTFGRYLIRNPSMLFHSNDTDDFRTFFKGLHFQLISPGNPIFISLSVSATTGYYANYFALYGHNEYGISRSISFILDAVTTNASFNLYMHDYSTAEADKKIKHINDTNYLDTITYAQSFNGVYTRFELPGLDSLKKNLDIKNIAVNRGRLKIPIFYDNYNYIRKNLPYPLYLKYVTTSGRTNYVPEIATTFYDGTPDTTATSEADDVYNLNVANFIQMYLEDKADTILPVLEMYLPSLSVNNLLLRGNGSYKPVRFEFTYTRF